MVVGGVGVGLGVGAGVPGVVGVGVGVGVRELAEGYVGKVSQVKHIKVAKSSKEVF